MAQDADLESIVADITTSTSPSQLLNRLRAVVKREVGETILASVLPGGQDPLTVLDPQANTLGFLFLLCARRLYLVDSHPLTWSADPQD